MMKKSVMKQLVLLFLAILLPVILIGLSGLQELNRRAEKEVLQSLLSSTCKYGETLDEQISQSHALAGGVLIQNQVKKLSNPRLVMSQYDHVTNVNIAIDLLTNVSRSSQLIKNVRLYLRDSGRAYNDAGNYSSSNQMEISEEQYSTLLELRKSPDPLHVEAGRLVMLTYSSLLSPLAVCEIELDINQIEHSLYANLLYDNAFYLMSIPNEDFRLSNIAEPELYDAVAALESESLDNDGGYRDLYYEGSRYYAFLVDLPYINGRYYRIIPHSQLFGALRYSSVYAALFSVVVVIGFLAFLVGANRMIHKPLKRLVAAFEGVKDRGFDVRVPTSDTAEFAYLYEGFNRMAERMDILIEKEYQTKILLQKAELKQLQAQINPHFLYNSFFMLHHKISRGIDDDAKEIARLLGQYFQYITRSHSDMVSLKDEYNHAVMYAAIQGKRFEGRIMVQMDPLPEQYEAMQVPKLIIQPILENAFSYGLENKEQGGQVITQVRSTPDGLLISIEDNGDELTDWQLEQINSSMKGILTDFNAAEPTGILNICKRMQIFYQCNDGMLAERSELGGLRVIFHFYNREEGKDVPDSGC